MKPAPDPTSGYVFRYLPHTAYRVGGRDTETVKLTVNLEPPKARSQHLANSRAVTLEQLHLHQKKMQRHTEYQSGTHQGDPVVSWRGGSAGMGKYKTTAS